MKKLNSFRKPCLESLEDRTLLAVTAGGFELAATLPEPASATAWIVNTVDDAMDWNTADDILSLREAISRAQTGDTITFDDTLAGGTITLCGSQLEVYQGIIIDATSIGGITIDANGQSRVFYVRGETENVLVGLVKLTITGGYDIDFGGGGIYCGSGMNDDHSELRLIDCTVSRNTSGGFGGGICNHASSLTIINSVISGNTAIQGGGVANPHGTLVIKNTTISGNSSYYGGGVLNDNSGNLVLINSIVSLNRADYDNDICHDHESSFVEKNNILGLDPGFVVAPIFESNKIANFEELDLSLTAESWAIDHGDNSFVETETDIVGAPRFYAACKEIAIVDIGAYEYQNQVQRGNTEEHSIIVTTTSDVFDDTDGLITLREAISYAVSGDTIKFDDALAGQTIILGGAELRLNKNLVIDASEIGGITIDGNSKSCVFFIDGGSEYISVELIALTVKNGTSYSGAGICNKGATLVVKDSDISYHSAIGAAGIENYDDNANLTLLRCSITNNISMTYSAGIANGGILSLINCSVAHNDRGYSASYYHGASYYYGSGIYNYGTLTITNTVVFDNEGAGIYNFSDLTLMNVTITNNGYDQIYNNSTGKVYAYNSILAVHGQGEAECYSTISGYNKLFFDPSHDDYTLANDSEAINAGDNSYVTTETDLAGNPRILKGAVDLGAYEYTGSFEPLNAPSILTGSHGYYVSYGANRHQVTWSAVDRAARYEFAYSEDGGKSWISLETNDTSAVVRGLTYGSEVAYHVRALSTRYIENSDWSAVKSFLVCPMDVNGDGDISGADRTIVSQSWLAEEGNENYRYYADINGDGDVSGPDRNLLSANWLCDTDDPYLLYPRPVAADMVFAEFVSADLGVDLDEF